MKPHVDSRRQRYLNHLSFQAILHPLENPGALPKQKKLVGNFSQRFLFFFRESKSYG